jgi:hypothetical protein
MATVTTRPTGDLHHHYQGQTEAQDCYVELDCRVGALHADWNAEIGNSVPMAVWWGYAKRWAIARLRPAAADELLVRITPFAQRVGDGFGTKWDGQNTVATYSADADDAMEEIERLCNETRDDPDYDGLLVVWDAGEWYDAGGTDHLGVTIATTDAELETIEERERAEALHEGVDVLHGLTRLLEELREEARELADDEDDEVDQDDIIESWDASEEPIWAVLNDEGLNMADARLRHTELGWVYVDEEDGWSVEDVEHAQRLLQSAVPLRFAITLAQLAGEYGVPLEGALAPHGDDPVTVNHDDAGWHVGGHLELLDSEWAPQTDKQAHAVYLATKGGDDGRHDG